jgi:hypothetical protein
MLAFALNDQSSAVLYYILGRDFRCSVKLRRKYLSMSATEPSSPAKTSIKCFINSDQSPFSEPKSHSVARLGPRMKRKICMPRHIKYIQFW